MIEINGEWWERTTPPWIKGYRPISTYKRVPKPVIFPQKFDNISKKGKFKMTFEDAAKLDPRIMGLYIARPNKKDGFSRWYKRFRKNFTGFNIEKENATPTQIEAFKARTNKKDSFTRWFQKNGSI